MRKGLKNSKESLKLAEIQFYSDSDQTVTFFLRICLQITWRCRRKQKPAREEMNSGETKGSSSKIDRAVNAAATVVGVDVYRLYTDNLRIGSAQPNGNGDIM